MNPLIRSISISNVATFGTEPVVMDGLSDFNYLFGSNGTGKTTISRVIADESQFPGCTISWQRNQVVDTVVLNRDFIERNFSQLKGVFTLGEREKDAKEEIDQKQDDMTGVNSEIARLERTLHGDNDESGKVGDLNKIEKSFEEKCWSRKKKFDDVLGGGFSGFRNSARNFKEKVLSEYSTNTSSLLDFENLSSRAETIFGEKPVEEPKVSTINAESLISHQSDPILLKKVIGKADVDISAMIDRLQNSDWVRQGIKYFSINDDHCPFCQQVTSESFKNSLDDYFDDEFDRDSRSIDALIDSYQSDSQRLDETIRRIVDNPGKYIDVEKLDSIYASLKAAISANRALLEKKKSEPSRAVTLDSLSPYIKNIQDLIEDANRKIDSHNQLVRNITSEQKTLTSEIWKFVLEDLKVDIDQFLENKSNIESAITSINQRLSEKRSEAQSIRARIKELESQITSVKPTVDRINGTLKKFGFDSFELEVSVDGKSYLLKRRNGDDARESLSEGEKTFVVFLYFYHLLQGSLEESGVTRDRVVVFDDPISSLDSDVLFIVSTLIRDICEKVRKDEGLIRQVFVLTHNIYFHREVTYRHDRPLNGKLREETFWIVRKLNSESKVQGYDENLVKSSYELLWSEIREADPNNKRIENTMRRILEHYFKILGGINPDRICDKFDGEDQLICKSLFSWVNAGSHQVVDDAYVTPSDQMIENSKRVFRKIFEVTENIAHFKMMMGEEEAA